MTLPLKERLKKAASLVGTLPACSGSGGFSAPAEGRIVAADVGCDHAYLSLFLLLSGRCQEVVASDIRPGPLEAAVKNIRQYGCEGKIHTVLADGLAGCAAYHLTDVVICGMGGDTILGIIKNAPFAWQKGTRLILQPMTGIAELILTLASMGFRVYAERYALEGRRPYRILAAVYEGVLSEVSIEEALIGSCSCPEDCEAFAVWRQKVAAGLRKKLRGCPNNSELQHLLKKAEEDFLLDRKEGS